MHRNKCKFFQTCAKYSDVKFRVRVVFKSTGRRGCHLLPDLCAESISISSECSSSLLIILRYALLGHYRSNCHFSFLLVRLLWHISQHNLFNKLIIFEESIFTCIFFTIEVMLILFAFVCLAFTTHLFESVVLWSGDSNCSWRTSITLWHSVCITVCQRSVHFNLQIFMKAKTWAWS